MAKGPHVADSVASPSFSNGQWREFEDSITEIFTFEDMAGVRIDRSLLTPREFAIFVTNRLKSSPLLCAAELELALSKSLRLGHFEPSNDCFTIAADCMQTYQHHRRLPGAVQTTEEDPERAPSPDASIQVMNESRKRRKTDPNDGDDEVKSHDGLGEISFQEREFTIYCCNKSAVVRWDRLVSRGKKVDDDRKHEHMKFGNLFSILQDELRFSGGDESKLTWSKVEGLKGEVFEIANSADLREAAEWVVSRGFTFNLELFILPSQYHNHVVKPYTSQEL